MSPSWGFGATSNHIWIRGQGWKRNKGRVSFLTSAFTAHPLLCIRNGDPIDTPSPPLNFNLINYENDFRWTNLSSFRMMEFSCCHEFWKSLNEYFMVENEWEWISARTIWSHPPVLPSALASLFTSIFDDPSLIEQVCGIYFKKDIQIAFCSHWKRTMKSINDRKGY